MTKSLCAVVLVSLFLTTPLRADEAVEKAAVGIGLTAGNLLTAPAKAVSVSMGLITGVLSVIFTGGDTEVARQTWQNSTEGPYLITPEVARKAVGHRPELSEQDTPSNKY